ncbi:MAG: glycoside hydrolase family 2 TIM barrel-domain containing protein [Caldilineaceae bacterium]
MANAQAHVTLTLHVAAAGRYTVGVTAEDDAFAPVTETVELAAGVQDVALTLAVPSPRLWSPESPHLYHVRAALTPAAGGPSDEVATYFGMRTVSRAKWAGKEYEYILLNGEPVYLRGALDQAFHPETLHAYPSDDVIRGDIQLAKDLGLNMLRCHIKINDPRYYYWADKLGLLMMYDLPSPDLDTPAMRRMYEAALPRAMARDFNSPSIFAWVLFNETWGLTEHDTAASHRWVQRMLHTARALDPTRLVEDNSPCHYNHVESDINSWHFYINDYRQVRRHIQSVVDQTFPGSAFNYVGGDFVQGDAPLMNSEYGGIAARDGDQDIAWCFKYQTNELRRHGKICGYVYTELDDIEWEHNGFVNYDRSAKEFGYDHFVPGMTVADLNGADFVGVDAPPCRTVAAGAQVDVPIFVSHWGAALDAAQVQWTVTFTDRFGHTRTVAEDAVPVTPALRRDRCGLAPPHAAGRSGAGHAGVGAGGRERCAAPRIMSTSRSTPWCRPWSRLTAAGRALRPRRRPRHLLAPAPDSGRGRQVRGHRTRLGRISHRPARRRDRGRPDGTAPGTGGERGPAWPRSTGSSAPTASTIPRPKPRKRPATCVHVNGIGAGTLHLPDDPAGARRALPPPPHRPGVVRLSRGRDFDRRGAGRCARPRHRPSPCA